MISSLELAKICGVSQGTVDRALHDRSGISPATKGLILEEAERHGYRPNPTVVELLSGRSGIVGAIVPGINTPFFMDLVQSVTEALGGFKLRLYLTMVSDLPEFSEILSDFAARRFRAAIVVPPVEGLALPEGVGRTMKIASLLSRCSGENTRLFAPDEVETGRNAAQYLIGMGHRSILHVTFGRKTGPIEDRAAGYAEVMAKRMLKPDIRVFGPENELREVIVEERPTAVFCHNDWLALSVIRNLRAEGLQVPEDVSVLGVDNSPTFTDLFPGITSMEYPRAQVARAAARWIGIDENPSPIAPLRIVEGNTVRRL